ncbi:MAG: NAD-dependent epimerase/dehydratase family protein [Endomicrobium sp.]|jgi:nucleoside-diphosphate-sugar epimerase|nr:NAD-dependent epimerase/dehydratase family protein [Endomicrobium sp.]
MLRVLVTGANGFVGSHIVEMMLSKKYQVTCIVRKNSDLSWISHLPVFFKYGDLSDIKFLEICVKDIDVIVHCAGSVRAFNREDYFKINVEYTKNLCNAVLKINPSLQKFIFISSQAAMGPSSSENPKKLDEEETPVSDYGLSKIVAEEEIRELFSGRVSYTILRPASVYGPRDKDIFIFFNLVNKHLRPFTVEKRILQLVYVKDIAQAVAACIDNKNSDNKTYYLAEETPYTWSEVGQAISKAVGRTAMPIPVPDFVFKFAGMAAQSFSYITKKPAVLNKQKIKEMLQEYWIADNLPARADLGIEFTKLEIASKITYNWYLNNKFF